MSDSDAEPAPALPPDAKIEQTLRRLVREIWLSGDHQNLTVKRVRKSVEEQLRLPDNFLKNDSVWKDRSKNVITDQVSVHEREEKNEDEPDEPDEPQKIAPVSKSRPVPQKRKASTKKQTTAATKSGGRKRRKVSVSDDEAEDTAVRSDASEPPELSPKKPTKKSRVVEEDSEGEDDPSPAPPPASSRKSNLQSGPADDNDDDTNAEGKPMIPPHNTKTASSDSEMSVLIDEPPKKKRQRKTGSTKERTSKSNKKSKPKDEKEIDQNEAEIKRLQGWLVKCGIRKLWGKELKPFDTPKAKISHLKEMLKDAGMEGRYSVEKARQIKERRELAADLEAVQEGAKRWGQSESEEDDGARPKRRLAKGLKDLEDLIESEGEETD